MLNDEQLVTLIEVSKGKSVREIAKAIGKSVGWAHKIIHELQSEGYITIADKKHRGRSLTAKGREAINDYWRE